jgi:hypothetical protein
MSTRVPLVIEQGSTFSVLVELFDDLDEPLDVTNMTASGKMRKQYTSSTSVNFDTQLSNGELILELDYIQTANIEAGRYVYDVEITDTQSNTVVRLIEGIVTVTPEVTK